ncbi:UNVERIFIED_CONTAM: hypothetical protein K2H54_077217 [Gekko kuhli]
MGWPALPKRASVFFAYLGMETLGAPDVSHVSRGHLGMLAHAPAHSWQRRQVRGRLEKFAASQKVMERRHLGGARGCFDWVGQENAWRGARGDGKEHVGGSGPQSRGPTGSGRSG